MRRGKGVACRRVWFRLCSPVMGGEGEVPAPHQLSHSAAPGDLASPSHLPVCETRVSAATALIPAALLLAGVSPSCGLRNPVATGEEEACWSPYPEFGMDKEKGGTIATA